ncbi:MAG: hypothetical protein Q8P49_02445, partial [Candidatus Liptonbacteria bacterium]|nr:hypothetical protein [Candidatus Liptonbacteria bacterium]
MPYKMYGFWIESRMTDLAYEHTRLRAVIIKDMFLEKIKYYGKRLLALLRVRPLVGGMEISDLVMRFIYFDDASWHLSGIRLPPGVMEAGKIKDYAQFVAALKALKLQAFSGKNIRSRINTIVSLSSVSIYSQVFSLPIIEGENLEKAIQLNIQMVSPIDIAQAYSGWQTVGKDQGSLRLEVLSAFIDRPTVDEISKALLDAGFLVVAMEPRALALARVLKEIGAGFDRSRSYIVIALDNSGLDFLIVRRGQLYFEYFNPWRDIVDDKGQIPLPAFEAAVIRSLHQVMNFYSQHWPEPISEVVLSAAAFHAETEKIIQDNFSLPVRDLALTISEPIGVEWTIALGCALRGQKPRGKDQEMSLLGIGAEEEFRREQILNFARFWRLLMPSALAMLLLAFSLADLFLLQTKQGLESHSLFTLNSGQAKESEALAADATDFNHIVALIRGVQATTVSQSVVWDAIGAVMAANGVTPSRLTAPSPGAPIILSGTAKSSDALANFK